MGDIVTKRCGCCKNEINIDTADVRDVIYFGKLYYHIGCFSEMATKKAAGKRGKPAMWAEALSMIGSLEKETARKLVSEFAFHDLNVWLLDHYDISVLPSRFYQVVHELANGKYKGRMCNPVDIETLCGCWKWGQHKLDEISVYNRSKNKGPVSDADRVMYDLAVLVGKVPMYLADVAKANVAHQASASEDKQPKIDYSVISNCQNNNDDNDILDLIDEVF